MERRRFAFSALSFAFVGGSGLEVHAALGQADAAAGARLAMERGAIAAVRCLHDIVPRLCPVGARARCGTLVA